LASEAAALLLCGALVGSVGAGLLSEKVSTSLISLFYASLALGLTFAYYGDALLGVLTMTTFAGAVSVLMLTVILVTGEPGLSLDAKGASLAAVPLAAAVGGLGALATFPGMETASTPDSSLGVLAFAWALRPWDILILAVVLTASLLAVVAILGGEE
jgi:hypothetical protein